MDTSPVDNTEEQNIDEELTEYGVQEQGMTLDEKKSLLLVFKNSENTAIADEHRRVGLSFQDTSNSTSNQIDDPKNNNNGVEIPDVSALECFSYKGVSFPAISRHCITTVDNEPNDSNDSHNARSPEPKGVTDSTSKFTPKTSRLSVKSRIVDDEVENIDDFALSNNNSPKCKSPPFQNLFEKNTKDTVSIEDSISLKNDLPLVIHKKEDRKRNIDVFNAVKDCNEQPLMINKQFNIVGKTPYYVVPHGMDIKDFTVHFKEQLAAIATNLLASQSKSVKLVPWGEPVVVSNLENSYANITFDEIIGPVDSDTVNPIAQNQRYNFRGRINKRKCEDDIFSDEESSEEEIFLKKANTGRPKISERTKTPIQSGSIAKRKSIFGDIGEHLGETEVDLSTENTCISNKERLNDGETEKDSVSENETKNKCVSARIKNICKSGILRTKEADEHSSESKSVPLELFYDDEEDEDYKVSQENNIPKRKKINSNNKLNAKNKKKVSKPISLNHADSNEEGKHGEIRGVSKLPTPEWLNTTCFGKQEEDSNVIKPGPVNLKMRKLKRLNPALGRSKKKVTKLSSQEVDEIILPIDTEENSVPIQMDEGTACPICEQLFSADEIVGHAADCYNVDDVAETDVKTTSRCPICVESFPTGSIFESHAKSCQVKQRRVPPPVVGPTARNKSKR